MATKKGNLHIDKVLGKGKAIKRIDGADGLSVALIFSRNRDQRKLQLLEAAIDSERNFVVDDTKRFREIMDELYYDSLIHFGSNNHWLAMRNSENYSPVPQGVSQLFPRNPEAARILLEEMANEWAGDEAKTIGNTPMTNAAVLAQVTAMRASPEKVMIFIGSRYKSGHFKQAALAFRHAQKLAIKFAAKYIAEHPIAMKN
jgi:hypothetical protein